MSKRRPDTDEFDYIVIGAGSFGCALYLRALLQGRSPDHDTIRSAVGTLSRRLDGQTLSAEDFAACLEVNATPLAIQVEQTEGLLVARGVRAEGKS